MTYTFGDTRLPKRFWDKVQIDPDTCCWEWTAYRNTANPDPAGLRPGSRRHHTRKASA